MAAAVAQQPVTAPVTRFQGVDKQSSGYKLLAAMGWKEGEGLGADRQGIKEHIKVKKKFENWGVGAVSCSGVVSQFVCHKWLCRFVIYVLGRPTVLVCE